MPLGVDDIDVERSAGVADHLQNRAKLDFGIDLQPRVVFLQNVDGRDYGRGADAFALAGGFVERGIFLDGRLATRRVANCRPFSIARRAAKW